jgi:hypothetical protein
MAAKGTPAYYAERRQQPTAKPAPRSTMTHCSSPACGLPFLSYHLKCPFCGTAAQEFPK